MIEKLPPKRIVYNNQIELRLLSPRDGSAIYQGVKSSLTELKHFMSWAHYEITPANACAIYAQFEAKSLLGEEINLAGFDLHNGEFLFCCSLLPGSRLNPQAFEIGYWVSSSKTGKGLGTIAAKILIFLAFSTYRADRVSVVCNPDNRGSLKVIEKSGFRYEGCLRNYLMQPTPEMVSNGYSPVTDAHAYSITREDIQTLSWFEEYAKNLVLEPYNQ